MGPHVNRFRVTTLMENTSAHGGILGNFALSMLVETNELCLLFDCGRGIVTLNNSTALKIDLA